MSDPAPASTFERRFATVVHFMPYLTLAIATPISLAITDRGGEHRLATLGLVGVALAWVTAVYLLPGPAWRTRHAAMAVYLAGYLVTAFLLMRHDPIFLIYGVSGFFQAQLFLGTRWTYVVGGVSALALYTSLWDWSRPNAGQIILLVILIAVHAAAVGAGLDMAVRNEERQQKYRKAVADLERAAEENAGLHAQLVTQAREAGVLDERQRMAREIHDTLAQGLTGIITQLQAAERTGDMQPHVGTALGLARDSLAEARRSVQALRPGELEDAHLPDALSGMAKGWAEDAGIDLRFETTGEAVPLSPAIEVALFRVAQEALTNVARHARATRVGLTLSYSGDVVLLDVRDDGDGIGDGENERGFGLNSMRQRVRGVGGTLEIESTPGEGTAISAAVPALQVGPA